MRAYPLSLATILAIAVIAAPAREPAEAPEDAKTVAVLNAPEPGDEDVGGPDGAEMTRGCADARNQLP